MPQIFIEGQQDKLTALNIEIQDEVMATLIEAAVVDVSWLIQQTLLASCLNRCQDLLIPRAQVVQVELLLLDKEE